MGPSWDDDFAQSSESMSGSVSLAGSCLSTREGVTSVKAQTAASQLASPLSAVQTDLQERCNYGSGGNLYHCLHRCYCPVTKSNGTQSDQPIVTRPYSAYSSSPGHMRIPSGLRAPSPCVQVPRRPSWIVVISKPKA